MMVNANTYTRSELLRALEGLRNWHAIILLIASLLLAVLIAAVGKATDSGWIAFFFGLLASLVWLFGVSAAGLVLMDVARGLEPPSVGMAFFGGAFSFVKVVVIFLLALAIGLLYWLAWAIVFFICKIPFLGPFLYAIALPVAIILTAVVMAGFWAGLSLAFPAVWEGHTITAAIARLVAIAGKKPVEAFTAFLLLFLLASIVSVVVFTLLGIAAVVVGSISVLVLGSALGLTGMFAQLGGLAGFGLGGMGGFEQDMGGGQTSGYLIAAAIGAVIVWSIASAAITSVVLMGINLIYLNLCEGVDASEAEAMLSEGLEQAKQKAGELQDIAKRHAEGLQKRAREAEDQRRARAQAAAVAGAPIAPITPSEASAASAPIAPTAESGSIAPAAATAASGSIAPTAPAARAGPICPACGASLAVDAAFCGECGSKVS